MSFTARVVDLLPRTWSSILYLLVSVFFTITVVILEAFVFAWFSYGFGQESACSGYTLETVPAHSPCASYLSLKSTIPTYMALFIFAGVYQIFVAFWALRRRNIVQLVMLIFFACAMLLYAGIQFNQIGDSDKIVQHTVLLTDSQVRAFIIAIPCIIASECAILSLLTWMLYGEYNVAIFEKIGPDKSFKRGLRDLLFFETLILFDFFFFVGFTLQFVFIILETKDVEFGLTIAVIPITAIVLIAVIISVYKENKPIVYCFFPVCLCGLAYFIFKLVRIYTTKGPKHYQYLKAEKTLTVFAAITIVFLLITIGFTFKVLKNFDKGLKGRSKMFHANERLQQEIDLGGPSEAADNEMDEIDNRSLHSTHTLQTLASINSDMEDTSYDHSKVDGPNSNIRPVYSDANSINHDHHRNHIDLNDDSIRLHNDEYDSPTDLKPLESGYTSPLGRHSHLYNQTPDTPDTNYGTPGYTDPIQ